MLMSHIFFIVVMLTLYYNNSLSHGVMTNYITITSSYGYSLDLDYKDIMSEMTIL